MISDDDLQVLAAAIGGNDQAALDRLAPRLGVALDLVALQALAPRLISLLDLAKLALAAVEAPHGLAVTIAKKPRSRSSTTPLAWECGLAVRDPTSVVVGVRVQIGAPATIPKAWPELSPWSKELARNRGVAEQWAAATGANPATPGNAASGTNRRRFPLIARPKLVGTGTRITETELLAEIVAHPTDPAPRLVLADLLLQRGDVRGELIQLAQQLATAELDDTARDALRARIIAIETDHGARLAGEIAEYVTDYRLVGGFVDCVTMSATAFRKHGARLFALQPIRKLILQPSTDRHLRLLAGAEHLPRLRALELGNYQSKPDVTLPFPPGRLAALEELRLSYCRLLAVTESQLAGLDAPRLRKLDARGADALPPAALRGLAANPRLAETLEHLYINVWEPRGDDVAAGTMTDEVFASWTLPALRILELGSAFFAAPHRIAELVRRAPKLTAYLQTTETDRSVVDALLDCRELERLEVKCRFDLAMLDRALALPRLAILAWYGGGEVSAQVDRLLALPPTHSLRRVGIENYTFNPKREPDGPLHARFPWRPRDKR